MTKIEGFGKLKAWHLDWRHGIGYGQNFIGEREEKETDTLMDIVLSISSALGTDSKDC